MHQNADLCAELHLYMEGPGFCYRSLLFGAIAGPLIWGREAAFLMRAIAAMFQPQELGIQCYVDDPIAAVRGTAIQ